MLKTCVFIEFFFVAVRLSWGNYYDTIAYSSRLLYSIEIVWCARVIVRTNSHTMAAQLRCEFETNCTFAAVRGSSERTRTDAQPLPWIYENSEGNRNWFSIGNTNSIGLLSCTHTHTHKRPHAQFNAILCIYTVLNASRSGFIIGGILFLRLYRSNDSLEWFESATRTPH